MSKPIIINAFRGLGDIIFSIPIYREWIEQGHTVIHPFMNLYGSIWKHWPEITWLEKDMLNINYENSNIVETPNYKIIPIRFSDSRMKVTYDKVMRAKYDMFNMDFMKWREVTWERDTRSEDELTKKLGIQYGTDAHERYIVINNTFRHDRTGKVNILLDAEKYEGMKIIELRDIPGYTLLDWYKVLQDAYEIHSVGTSLCYMLDAEFFNLRCPVHYYIRRPDEANFNNYNYLLKRNYIWHEE